MLNNNNNRKKLNLEEKYHIFYQIQNLNSKLAIGHICIDTQMGNYVGPGFNVHSKAEKNSNKGGRHGSVVKITVPEDPGSIPRTHMVPEPSPVPEDLMTPSVLRRYCI